MEGVLATRLPNKRIRVDDGGDDEEAAQLTYIESAVAVETQSFLLLLEAGRGVLILALG